MEPCRVLRAPASSLPNPEASYRIRRPADARCPTPVNFVQLAQRDPTHARPRTATRSGIQPRSLPAEPYPPCYESRRGLAEAYRVAQKPSPRHQGLHHVTKTTASPAEPSGGPREGPRGSRPRAYEGPDHEDQQDLGEICEASVDTRRRAALVDNTLRTRQGRRSSTTSSTTPEADRRPWHDGLDRSMGVTRGLEIG